MNKKIVFLAAVVSCALLGSCASMYISPSVTKQIYRKTVHGNAVLVFKLMQRLLPMTGYNIASSDAASGTITTAPVEMSLDADSCDCGSAMGLPVVKTGEIKFRVSFEVALSGNEMIVNAVITPELSSTLAALYAGMNIQCVSKGKLEEQMADKILRQFRF